MVDERLTGKRHKKIARSRTLRNLAVIGFMEPTSRLELETPSLPWMLVIGISV